MDDRRNFPASGVAASGFQTTRWSMVLRAGGRDREAAEALAALCDRYWYPLYAYVRRRVANVDEAQDLTQGFFARLLEKNALAAACPDRGRFRGFLLGSIKNFLANARDQAQAQKRGGDRRCLSIDFASGESRLHFEPADDLTPDRVFDRQWALTLLACVMERLQAEYATLGKAAQFERLKETLTGDRERLPYAELGAELGISEEAARQAAARLRKRYRALLRQEVAQTVDEPADVDDEIRRLFEVLAR
jgi:RNA polymerase sigma-70 factor (ECF subfamily)